MENVSTTPFQDTGFNSIETATEIFTELSLNPQSLFPQDIAKLQDIAKFINSYDDGLLLVKTAVMKNNRDIKPLDLAWGYIKLQEKKISLKKDLDKLNEEISLYE